MAKDYLGISESTEQVWNIQDFVRVHDASKTNAPISNDYIGDVSNVVNQIETTDKRVFLISGKPGIGKTRLAIQICSHFEKDKYNVICVKNNNQSIYQDVKNHIDSEKENIIFIDDINLIQSFKPTLALLQIWSNIRFILTVRDYARSEIVKELKDFDYEVIEPHNLEDDDFQRLINQFSEGKLSDNQVEHIKKISKGNSRIAVIATKISYSKDLSTYNNEVDILKDYYEEILEQNEILQNEQKVLFILSYLKKTRLDNLSENSEFIILLKIAGLTEEDFQNGVEKLRNRELCDVLNNRVVKISDQSLDDYIVIKMLSKEKVSVLGILNELYPRNDKRVINLLNQFSNYTTNEIEIAVIASSVINYYDETTFTNIEEKERFLSQFCILLPTKVISYIKEKMSNIESEKYSINNFINTKDKSTSIKDNVLLMINTLSQTKYYKLSLQLLLNYFSKKPDTISEVYTILERNFGLVTEKDLIYYGAAQKTLDSLAKLDFSKIYNQELVVSLLKQYFKVEVERTTGNEKQFTFGRYTIPDGRNLVEYHKRILEILSRLYEYNSDDLKEYIEKILYNFQYTILNYAETHSMIIREDLLFIKRLFYKDFQTLSLVDEKILYSLQKAAEERGFDELSTYQISERQEIYNFLTNERHACHTEECKEELQEFANTYIDRWTTVFSFVSQFQNKEFMKDNKVEVVLFNIFLVLNQKDRLSFFEAIFREEYVFERYRPIDFFSNLDKEEMLSIIENAPESEKYKWQLAYLTSLEDIQKNDVGLLESLIENNPLPKYYSILHFERFIHSNEKIKKC